MKYLGNAPAFTSQAADNISTMTQDVRHWQKDKK
jgi:hypothetical protein